MSAFLVSHKHVNTILSAYERLDRNKHNLTELGKILLKENARSVAYRYNEPEDEEWKSYKFKAEPVILPVVAYIKLCNCLDYQSCECADWEKTEAYSHLTRIREAFISILPGYDSAEWTI